LFHFYLVAGIQESDERVKDERHSITADNSYLSFHFLPIQLAEKNGGQKQIMKEHKTNVGVELLFLLRQQRYLYHQFRMLTDRGRQLVGTNSPELLLEVIFGRRKLVEKLRKLNEKLRPIRANWRKLSVQIGSEHRIQTHKMANQVQEIIREILAVAPSETARCLPLLNENCRFDELFAQTQ